MKKLLIFSEQALFNDFVQPTDFVKTLKMLEKLSENGFFLALVSTSPEETLLRMTRRKRVDISHLFHKVQYVRRVYDLDDYLVSIISWGKRKKLSLGEMVYFGRSLYPDYSATRTADGIEFIGVLISQNLNDPFAPCVSITAEQKVEARNLWQFLPKYLELAEAIKET
ncbi:MAG: hypothetical protein WCW61_01725 [Patescibacteria group bacterium]|jgi:hypothetical protein